MGHEYKNTKRGRAMNYWKPKNIIALMQDASSRSYSRLELLDSKKTYVMVNDPQLSSSEFIPLSSFLLKNNFNVPKIIDLKLKENKAILEDLGSMHLCQWNAIHSDQESILSMYKKIIDQIYQFQKLKYGNLAFNWEKYLQEIQFSLTWYFEKFLKRPFNQNDQKEIKKTFEMIMESYFVRPHYFTHRDLHSKNIMIKNNEIYFIDFQDARFGPNTYDLASLLDDFYYYLSPKTHSILFKYAYNKFKHDELDGYDFTQSYYICLLQRSFKVLGTFSYQYLHKNNPHYLPYIGVAIEKIKLSCEKIHLKKLKNILMAAFYEK